MKDRILIPAAVTTAAAGLAFALWLCSAGDALQADTIITTTNGVAASISAPAAPSEVEPKAAPEPTPAPPPALTVEVTDTMPFSPQLEPATFEGVFRVLDPAAGYGDDVTSTTYLLAHARTPWRGHGPGNDWQELKASDLVAVDGETFRVTSSLAVEKAAIGEVNGLWEHVPGRVVLITCIPQLDGSVATHNRVVVLEPAGRA